MSFAVVEADGSLRFKEDVDAPSKGCVRVSDTGLLLFALLLERVEKMPAFGGSDDIGESVAMLEIAESCSRYRTLAEYTRMSSTMTCRCVADDRAAYSSARTRDLPYLGGLYRAGTSRLLVPILPSDPSRLVRSRPGLCRQQKRWADQHGLA